MVGSSPVPRSSQARKSWNCPMMSRSSCSGAASTRRRYVSGSGFARFVTSPSTARPCAAIRASSAYSSCGHHRAPSSPWPLARPRHSSNSWLAKRLLAWSRLSPERMPGTGWSAATAATPVPPGTPWATSANTTTSSHFREAFAKKYLDQYQGSEGTVTKKAKELWTLRELRPGDIVVANRGINEILGIGTVVEPGYAFRENRPEWRQTVAVEWTDTEPRTIPKQQPWEVTQVADVPLDLYKGIVSYQPPPKTTGAVAPKPPSVFERVVEKVRDAELIFSDELLSTYLLALQTKRFVILERHLRHREDPARHGRRRGPRRGAASHHPGRGGARRRLPAHRLPLHAAVQPLHPAQAPAGDRDPATGERPGGASGGRGDLPQGPAAAAPEPGWRQRHGRPPPRRGEPVVPLGAERGGRVLHRRGERGGRRSPHHRRAQGRPAQDRAQRDLGRHPRPPGLDRRPGAAWLLQPHPAAVRLHAVPRPPAGSQRRGPGGRPGGAGASALLCHPRRDEPGPRGALLRRLPVLPRVGQAAPAPHRRRRRQRRDRETAGPSRRLWPSPGTSSSSAP